MRRYWLLVIAMLALMLALYGGLSAAGLAVDNPERVLTPTGPGTLAGVLLLAIDVVAPVPSSLVMVAHGALFGALVGSVLSLVGSLGAFALAFWIGRRGGRLLERLVGVEERMRADHLLARYGVLAIAASRPVPMLAETTAMMAGASSVPWDRAMLFAAAGTVPQAALYALAGSVSASFGSGAIVFVAVLITTSVVWLVLRRVPQRQAM